ncbi:DUF4190 domain-containing protein [Mycobacterium frederiksbergense]|uniref:DUF4190 domain-containing protein n=1 Tax=Mycolicibacterium frederiksbergense TaxID=117567 RepID=A0A6H0S969_9MYCO|nr:DUF4190 domain-containing protein [Mycolicibacterium frederiksbergense]MCV7044528.1 DUF4190 domain-containing protein [Mycolicibacterium frederiksbergense]QIV84152.1 DUF4190 domain-containing protein [Mycolicibacterium frederiksbergense]
MSSPGPYPAPHAPYPAHHPPYPGHPPTGPRNQLGSWALVLAMLALLFSWSIVGAVIGGSIAVVLGFAGRGRAARGEADNGPIANAGIGLGALAVIVGVAFVPIWIGFFTEAGMGDYVRCMEQAGTDRTAQGQCENTFRERVERDYGLSGG